MEPLPPPSWNIPGTDIPDKSHSEFATRPSQTKNDADPNMNTEVDVPNKGIDPGGEPPVDQYNYPGIINPPIRGSHRPHARGPFRR